MRWGDLRYAEADGHHVAFRELVGDSAGDQEIVMCAAGFIPIEALAGDPVARRLVEGLAGLGRLVVFDRRGIGLSDPILDWERPIGEQYVCDLDAVIDAVGYTHPTVFDWRTGRQAIEYAIAHPGRVGRLVLFNPYGPVGEEDETWLAPVIEAFDQVQRGEGNDLGFTPSRDDDPEFRAWLDAAGQAGASPSLARRLNQLELAAPDPDWFDAAAETLVLTRYNSSSLAPRSYFGRVATLLPNAVQVTLPDGDLWPIGGAVDEVLAEISRFLTGRVHLPAPERRLSAIMFTDLVDSTARAVSAGDAAWKRTLDRHDATTASVVTRAGGEVIKWTGDGLLALVPSATAGVDAAEAIRDQLRDHGLEVRIGIHVGEVETRGEDVSGVAVHIAARIMGEADAGEILLSDIAARLAKSRTEELGTRLLKGIDERWALHRVIQVVE